MSLTTYPIISTRNFAKTVGFFEDLFDFVPVYEADGYAHMTRKDQPEVVLGVLDVQHASIPESHQQETKGMILPLMTSCFDEAYEAMYYEGLEIIKEPTTVDHGYKHFLVADPNNPVILNIITAGPVAEAAE